MPITTSTANPAIIRKGCERRSSIWSHRTIRKLEYMPPIYEMPSHPLKFRCATPPYPATCLALHCSVRVGRLAAALIQPATKAPIYTAPADATKERQSKRAAGYRSEEHTSELQSLR